MISIIIPIYNAEQTLSRCLDSVLQQGFSDYELILIDDGSQDASVDICDEYARKDSRIVVVHKKNGGVSSARNEGLKIAKGEWVTFIDSDDYIGEDYLIDLRNFNKDILFVNYTSFYQNTYVEKKSLDQGEYKSIKDFLSKNITNTICRVPWGKFFRREIIDDIRFPESMKVGEDTCFLFDYLSKCNSIGFIKSSRYFFQHSELEQNTKYASSTSDAITSLKRLYMSFERLSNSHHISRKYFLSFIGYFKFVSRSEWECSPERWYDNQEIRSLYKYVWSDLPLLSKLRLYLSKMLRR